jgi:hypothetical protein
LSTHSLTLDPPLTVVLFSTVYQGGFEIIITESEFDAKIFSEAQYTARLVDSIGWNRGSDLWKHAW